jgi:predicted porin
MTIINKTNLLAALALLASANSQAQNVTLYGVLDTSLEYVTHANAAGDSVVRMPALTGSIPSRIGFRGTEDLGGGLQSFFVLESGLLLDSGGLNQGNRLFGRSAYVGLKGQWGSLTFGRQPNMSFYAYLKSDIMGPNLYALSSVDSYLPNARSDNAIGYLGKFGAYTVGATYSTGRDASSAGGPAGTNCPGELAGDARACRQVTAMLAYDAPSGAYGMATAYDILYGGAGAAAGLSNSAYHDERYTVNGYAVLGAARLGAGLIRRKTEALVTTKSKLYFAGISYVVSAPLVWDTQFVRLTVQDSPNGASLLATRLTYFLSKRTAVYITAGHMRNRGTLALPVDAGGTIAPGMSQSGIASGIRHTF